MTFFSYIYETCNLLIVILMKRGLFVVLFVCSNLLAFSQAYMKVTPYDTLGVAQIRVLYEMKFMPDTLNRTKFLKRMMVLDIGEHGFSRFTEYNNWRQDSITVARTKDGRISDLDIFDARKIGGRVHDRYQLLKCYPDASHLQYIGFAGLDKFIYTEETPEFHWQLKPTEKKEIGGYVCSLAIGNYAGRTYKAWFTFDIPVSDGPWKLSGLPGLILEVEDETGEYTYSCTRIQKRAEHIAIQGMDSAFKTTRERFLKAFLRAKSDPGAIVKGFSDKLQGIKTNSKRKKNGYNPQEKY